MRLAFILESSRLRQTHAEYFELLKIEISKVQAGSAPGGTLHKIDAANIHARRVSSSAQK